MISVANKVHTKSSNYPNTEPLSKDNHSIALPIISIITALVSTALLIFCLMPPKEDTGDNGVGAVWWIMVLFAFSCRCTGFCSFGY